MSNESTPSVPAGQPRPVLPQFDPEAPAGPAADDTRVLPTSATTELPVTPPATPYAYAVSPGTPATPGTPAASGTSAAASTPSPLAGPGVPLPPTGLPVASAPRWNARKTAVTAGLALLLTSAGAIGAAAAMPAGSGGGDTGFRGPGGGRSFPFPGGQQGQQGLPNQQNQQGTSPQQLPNLQNGVPGGGLGGIDPNQLGQLDPQDLLNQLNQLGQGGDPFSGVPRDRDGDRDGSQDGSQDGAQTT